MKPNSMTFSAESNQIDSRSSVCQHRRHQLGRIDNLFQDRRSQQDQYLHAQRFFFIHYFNGYGDFLDEWKEFHKTSEKNILRGVFLINIKYHLKFLGKFRSGTLITYYNNHILIRHPFVIKAPLLKYNNKS